MRLRDEVALNRGLVITYVLCTIAAIIMGIAAVVLKGEPLTGAYVMCMALAFAGPAAAYRGVWKNYARALEEVEADPEGLAYPEDYSVRTGSVIEKIQLPMKDYRAMFFAYGIIALSLFAGGAIVAALYFYAGHELIYLILGVGTIFGGVLLATLSAQAWRNWHAVKRFDRQSADQH